MATQTMTTVNFCLPSESSKTVCHNVTIPCPGEPPLLPTLFSCSNYTDSLPSCRPTTTVPPTTTDSMTTMSMTFVTTMTSTSTISTPQSCDATCIIIIVCIIALVIFVLIPLLVALVLYIFKKGPFKVRNRHECSRDFDRSDSAKQILPEEQHNHQNVELQVNIPHTWGTQDSGNSGISSATVEAGMTHKAQETSPQVSPVEETRLFPVSSAAGAASNEKEV